LRRRTTTAVAVGLSALALPAAVTGTATATAHPGASPSVMTGERALMPKAHRLVRLTSLGRVTRYDRAQRRLTGSAVRLRHRIAGVHGRALPAHTARRMRHRLEDRAPHRLRVQVAGLRRELRHAKAEAAAARATGTATGSSGAASSASPALEAIAACESGGNPAANTGNGFYGKYQFTQSTWASVGGTGNPAAASEAEQDMRAAMLYAQQGSAPWPVCGR
jgi:Transglycosylase-like domain